MLRIDSIFCTPFLKKISFQFLSCFFSLRWRRVDPNNRARLGSNTPLAVEAMNSPRLGGKGRTSARGTPRMGTPTGGSGSFIPPAPKGTLVLGKGKAKLRAVADASPLEPSTNMLMSREASYDVADAELFHSRIGSYQPAGKTVGEKGRIFAKSEEMTASFHEPIPLDVIRAAGVDGQCSESCLADGRLTVST